MSLYPQLRLRRLRQNSVLRSLVRESRVHPSQLVMPYFVVSGKNRREAIASLPGQFRLSPDQLLGEAEILRSRGVPAMLLFGIPDSKDDSGLSALDGPIPDAIALVKKHYPDLLLIADVCLCDYSEHGHCGVIERPEPLRIDNDASLEILGRIAAAFARAGADVIAPSDMMDGRVAHIRDALDAVGCKELPILSYAVKYASSFYGPFREALQSAPRFGDRRGYQMDPANAREALREAELDVHEGADILMVKPGLSSLDILYRLRERFELPLAVYQVSGEYAMIRHAAQQGSFDETAAVLETWLAFRRAGADIIVSYFARDFAEFLE